MEYGSAPISAMRVSNEDRNEAVERLQAAFTEGRFDPGELEARLDQAMNAKTHGDLEVALRQLPPAWSEVRLDTDTGDRSTSGHLPSATGAERLGGSVAHLSGYVTFFFGPALIAAFTRSRYVRQHAIEAANFQLNAFGAIIALGMAAVLTHGISAIAIPFVGLLWLAFTGVGGMAALVGNRFHYPWILRLLKS